MSGHTECDFETAIEAGLTSSGSYETRNPSAYDEALAFFPEDVSGFLKGSQPAKWQALEALLGPKAAAILLDSLWKELDLKGTLHVLRHGFKCFGKTFRMAYLQGVGARMRAGRRASNRRARHLPMRYETGLPSSVIRFRT